MRTLPSNKIVVKISICIFLIINHLNAKSQLTPYEQDPLKNTTATYAQLTEYYSLLAKKYPKHSRLLTYGKTDVGKPLQLFILSSNGIFNIKQLKAQHKTIFLINNGIHPGEPEGIDASMMLARDLLEKNKIPANTVIAIIPAYNIGGMLNRGVSRVNQNGPSSYGFRGNRQNMNLNRDFIKTDTKNSLEFQKIFNDLDPDVLLDNHTSDGADYQYIMTLIDTQKDKFNPIFAPYMKEKFTDELYKRMGQKGYKLIPYVDFQGETPEQYGIQAYLETPRYSTGYAALHNTIAYMPETHMWKPFQQRVESTYALMQYIIDIMHEQGDSLLQIRQKAKSYTKNQTIFPIQWQIDTTTYKTIPFYGYEAEHKISEVTGQPRLFYDRNKPFTRNIKLYDHYIPTLSITKPKAYIIPQAYGKVISLLQLNGVKMTALKHDTTIETQVYYITKQNTAKFSYEGHYLHNNIEIRTEMQQLPFYEGDYIAYTNQENNRYLIETLEPQATDSYYTWGFFDAATEQKEYFSPYIFEDFAAELLKINSKLKQEFTEAKEKDSSLAKNTRAQLDWVYKHTDYYEKSHNRYPIARIID